jgi:hypothetical protein
MKNKWMVIAAVGIGVLLDASGAGARSYNPIKWIKKSPGPTASQQLAANKEEEKKLTLQLQALLPPRTTLKDACTAFKSLEDCVAALHVSRNLKIKFNCLKWDITAARPNGDAKSCEAPPRDRALTLTNAIRVLSPDANAKAEAKSAEKRAREDIKDASS